MFDYKKYESMELAVRDLVKENTARNASEARKFLQEKIPKESYFQEKIIRHLKIKYPEAFVWKAAAGAYSRSGIPDVCCILEGRFYGFEVKRPLLGKASVIQEQTIKEIRGAGGVAELVSYPEEVDRIVRRFRNKSRSF